MRGMMFGLAGLVMVGCASEEPAGPGAGSFLPDGTLQARVLSNDTQVAIGGQLTTLATAFEPCEEPTINVGEVDFVFSGGEANADVPLPDVELCGIRIVVKDLVIEAEDDGVAKTVVGQDFDLWVPADAIPAGAEGLTLELGDADWLADFLPLAPEGTTLLNSEADEALMQAFFLGLDRGSSFEAQDI